MIAFVIYLIFVDLFLILPLRVLVPLNIIALIMIIGGVFLVEQQSNIILTAALIEAVGMIVPVFIIAVYQFKSRVQLYLNEKQIIEQNEIIKKALEDDYNQRLVSIEMRALRAQMNPHFIFNVLNSIKLYMVQNDAQTASNYLTKFSKLIRMILNNSKAHLVSLEDELDALKLYIEIENFRFNNKFDFNIKVDEEIDQEFAEIPPLILQPYVENAIWHGLMHKSEGRGLLSIDITIDNADNLSFVIQDNGIGRKQAALLKSNSARKKKHKSIGMELTEDRIEMTNRFYNTNASVEVIDLMDADGKAAGTKVILLLPNR